MNGFAAGVAALALSAVLVVVAASHTSVLVVDVALEDGPRLVAPVPYAVARAGLALAPQDVRRLDVPELADFADDLREILHVLEDTPDETFLLIERPSEHVVVAKHGGALRVTAADGDRTHLELTLPLNSLALAHDAYDPETGILHTGALVQALRSSPRGSLLHLVDGGTEVRIRTW